MAKATGGDIIAQMLVAEGVDTAFGLPDGTYHGLIAGMADRGIELVTTRHESSALHAAGAYARLTGKLGVAIASNGPGVANALPGVAVEQVEGNRVLLITSSRRSGIGYPDRGGTYQYFDHVGVISPMAKWSATAPSLERVPELLRTALRMSYAGRPGVVHIDIPESVINAKTKESGSRTPSSYRRVAPIAPSASDVIEAARLLSAARLPVIHAGGGVVHAQAFDALADLAHMLNAPVTTSWSASGSIPHTDDLAWPIASIEASGEVRTKADVLLILGSRVGETDWWGKSPYWSSAAEVIQVDIDPASLGLNKPTDLAVEADVGLFLAALITELETVEPPAGRTTAVKDLQRSRHEHSTKFTKHLADRSTPMNPAHLPHVARQTFDDNAILVADGGNTAVWCAFFWKVTQPGTTLGTPHMGHLGAGVGQALGAARAFPDRQIVCIIGDGAFGMHPQEVETAVRYGYRIVFIVVSDRQWGMVKMSQSVAMKPVKMMVKKSLDEGENINTDLGEIDYADLARSMGAHGERISSPQDIVGAIERSLTSGTTAVIHADVDPVKNLWAPGLLHFKKMHQEPGGVA
ncbi:MAG: thiamine pyrophosphate-binding protein [Actinomycetota bacterium]